MRRVVLILLVVVMVVSIAGAVWTSAAAAQEMECESPMGTIQSLRECVQHAYYF